MPTDAGRKARNEALRRGRAAFDRGAWAEAYGALTEAAADPDVPREDLEHLGLAAELVGQAAASHDAMARAHRRALDDGDPCRAAYIAFWLGFSLVDKGDMAQGGGWMARAATVIETSGADCVAAGFLLIPGAIQAMDSGESALGLERFRAAGEIAKRFGDPDLATMSLLGQGSARIELGEVEVGLRLLDEAMVAVAEGEVSPIVVGIVYCATIERCRRIFDLRRAQEWTAALSRWVDANPDVTPFRGQCLLFRADLLRLRGDWAAADAETERAHLRLAEPPPEPALGAALYQEGELHRLRGRFEEAERAYADATTWGQAAEPGRALGRLAQGRARDAHRDLESAIAAAPDDLTAAPLLEPAVEAGIAAGSGGAAPDHADRLRRIAAAYRTPMLAAMSARADGRVAAASRDPERAAADLRRALASWRTIDAAYEIARTRVLLAAALRTMGDAAGARTEVTAARATFEALGAVPDLRALEAVADGGGGAGGTASSRPSGLTPRELEVLRLLAAGRSNRAIAETLVLSEKTVARHVSNIFDKLDVSSRSAATAYAYEHDLVARST